MGVAAAVAVAEGDANIMSSTTLHQEHSMIHHNAGDDDDDDDDPTNADPYADWGVDRCLTLVLALLYMALFLTVISQLARIVYYRHRLGSFQVGFQSLCLVWTLLRSIWFAKALATRWSNLVEELIYWPPVNLEFATFSLLGVFFVRIIHQQAWRDIHRRVMAAWVALNLFLLFLNVLWIAYIGDASTVSEDLVEVREAFVASTFLILAVIIGYFSWRLIVVLNSSTAP
ncbi:hypothetical protein CAOG_08581, partial [Capsaspora owczarzaki ATCC 30864]